MTRTAALLAAALLVPVLAGCATTSTEPASTSPSGTSSSTALPPPSDGATGTAVPSELPPSLSPEELNAWDPGTPGIPITIAVGERTFLPRPPGGGDVGDFGAKAIDGFTLVKIIPPAADATEPGLFVEGAQPGVQRIGVFLTDGKPEKGGDEPGVIGEYVMYDITITGDASAPAPSPSPSEQ